MILGVGAGESKDFVLAALALFNKAKTFDSTT